MLVETVSIDVEDKLTMYGKSTQVHVLFVKMFEYIVPGLLTKHGARVA